MSGTHFSVQTVLAWRLDRSKGIAFVEGSTTSLNTTLAAYLPRPRPTGAPVAPSVKLMFIFDSALLTSPSPPIVQQSQDPQILTGQYALPPPRQHHKKNDFVDFKMEAIIRKHAKLVNDMLSLVQAIDDDIAATGITERNLELSTLRRKTMVAYMSLESSGLPARSVTGAVPSVVGTGAATPAHSKFSSAPMPQAQRHEAVKHAASESFITPPRKVRKMPGSRGLASLNRRAMNTDEQVDRPEEIQLGEQAGVDHESENWDGDTVMSESIKETLAAQADARRSRRVVQVSQREKVSRGHQCEERCYCHE
ncbi:hypothetical protein B0A48_17305 [Cryoendolithus antarcticus]|uniref:Uncharacterized protein n=1 Tax=Cryoendolithus antarcticus TaxID=1507870 RepID=A0A1V8SBV3_9PEZI|nr:hypothetical protein B0A48_17305 [Cryoendolithus antarcticus]